MYQRGIALQARGSRSNTLRWFDARARTESYKNVSHTGVFGGW